MTKKKKPDKPVFSAILKGILAVQKPVKTPIVKDKQ